MQIIRMKVGDVLELKKPHPCGERRFRVMRVGSEVRIGDGKVDFHGVIDGLYKLGYKGYITIEREIDGAKQLEDILHAREYLSAIIDEIYGG